VGLLNIGEEDCKGNDLAVRTYQLLQENPHVRFVGNAEGRDVLSGDFDVIVCDGFVGNIVLKFAEGIGGSSPTTLEGRIIRWNASESSNGFTQTESQTI
jgi:fatty acid/phospholipid biosynthesis enzyme